MNVLDKLTKIMQAEELARSEKGIIKTNENDQVNLENSDYLICYLSHYLIPTFTIWLRRDLPEMAATFRIIGDNAVHCPSIAESFTGDIAAAKAELEAFLLMEV